jgi:hypothetical protein
LEYIEIRQARTDRSMKKVSDLIEDLKKFPPDAYAAAYSAEATGIVIYPETFGIYDFWNDPRAEKADESVGFIDLYYYDPRTDKEKEHDL